MKYIVIVPYVYQSRRSGIGSNEEHDVVWYRRSFALPEEMKGKRILLHFGAVDYRCKVWVNGRFQAAHEGGHIGFEVDITKALEAVNGVYLDHVHITPDLGHMKAEFPIGKAGTGDGVIPMPYQMRILPKDTMMWLRLFYIPLMCRGSAIQN